MPKLYGYTVCQCIVASAPLVERRFREAGLIRQSFDGLISQGCYSAGAVEASKGTHDGGGVLDLTDFTPYRADADVLFTACGWIDFYRPYGVLYLRSAAHHHIVLNGCPHLAQGAVDQITDAKSGLNGLAGKGKDEGPRPLVTWQQAVAEDAGLPTIKEDDMGSLIFMRSIDKGADYEPGTVWLLRPGSPPRRLTPQEWALYQRLGAQRPGGDFLKAEVDIISQTMRP